MYLDQIKKIAYYRSRIIQDLTRRGIYPDDTRVSSRLAEIDSMLGIFQYMTVGVGSTFDTAKFNEDMLRILVDLKILYELALEISIKDYNELKTYCETHMAQLQNMANRYQYKTKFELDSTYLGNTVFFQSTGFDASMKNGIVTVKLGAISVEAQSKLACIFDADYVTPDKIVFTFKDSDGIVHNCSPYAYNKDFFAVPGNLKVDSYIVSVSSQNIRNPFICTPPQLEGSVTTDHRYLLFGGKGYLQTGYYNINYIEKFNNVPITITGGGIVNFFVVDGDYINFNFSTQLDNKNFEGTSITEMSAHQQITLEHSSTYSFDFVTNGTIYATRQVATVLDGDIYYPVPDQINDILVEDYGVGDKVTYDVTVTAGPFYDGNIPTINTVAIKQLSILETISGNELQGGT